MEEEHFIEIPTHMNDLFNIMPELMDCYEITEKVGYIETMSCLETSRFSDPLTQLFNLQIKENRYYSFKKNGTFFWEPKVFINGNPAHTLLDTGASCSVCHLKFLKRIQFSP